MLRKQGFSSVFAAFGGQKTRKLICQICKGTFFPQVRIRAENQNAKSQYGTQAGCLGYVGLSMTSALSVVR